MVNESEVITLLVIMGGALFIFLNLGKFERAVPAWRWLFSAFLILCAGWFLTVLESFLFPVAFNLLEHVCYSVSSILTAVWSFKVFVSTGQERRT